jgi:hypothetical protein
MRTRVEGRVERPPSAVFDFIARDHWRNHPRWDPNVVEIVPLDDGPIRVGSRAHVRRKRESDSGVLEVLEFEPDGRWVSRNQIGPFTLVMTALVEPADVSASRLILIGDTHARGAIRYALPLLGVVFRRQMRASLKRIAEMVETETAPPRP